MRSLSGWLKDQHRHDAGSAARLAIDSALGLVTSSVVPRPESGGCGLECAATDLPPRDGRVQGVGCPVDGGYQAPKSALNLNNLPRHDRRTTRSWTISLTGCSMSGMLGRGSRSPSRSRQVLAFRDSIWFERCVSGRPRGCGPLRAGLRLTRRWVPLPLASLQEIRQLCLTAKEVFMSQPNLLELEAPIKICGACRGFGREEIAGSWPGSFGSLRRSSPEDAPTRAGVVLVAQRLCYQKTLVMHDMSARPSHLKFA